MAGKNIIYGTAGSDTFSGTRGNDVFWDERGSNNFYGYGGSDTFVFGRNAGTNTIYDYYGGENTVLFLDGITPEELAVTKTPVGSAGKFNVEVSVPGDSGKLVIKDYTHSSQYAFAFPNGEIHEAMDFFEWTEIRTAQELSSIRDNLLGSYRLMADIDLSGMDWVPIGTSAMPFDGMLDGNGYAIAGRISGGSVRDCYAAGNASGKSGGFAGNISLASAKLENCYTVSNADGGFNNTGTGIRTSCYFDNERSSSMKEEGRTTAEMMDAATYIGWDFETVWEIEDGGYPTLRGVRA